MNKYPMIALCAAAAVTGLFAQTVPAAAQNRLRACADEWNAMKANNTVGDKKWADFRKECLARTAAPADAAPASAPATTPAPKASARTAAPKSTPAAVPGTPSTPSTPSDAVFPTEVSPKYSDERAALARMHTCRDQYQENKANNANGGLAWLQKGGGYYSECNKRLKEG
jgi:hypothetical protein